MLIKYRGTYPHRLCLSCQEWREQDYFAGAMANICESCIPEHLQPIPSEVLAREYARKRLVDKDGEYVIDSTIEGI